MYHIRVPLFSLTYDSCILLFRTYSNAIFNRLVEENLDKNKS